MDHTEIKSRAEAAGNQVAYAGEVLTSLIRAMADVGHKSYGSTEHKLARSTFADTIAAKGRKRQGGMTQYANAWDALIESEPSLGLEPRPRKGSGRNASAGEGAEGTEGSEASEAPAPAEKKLTNEQAIAEARPTIMAQAIIGHMMAADLHPMAVAPHAIEFRLALDELKKLKGQTPAERKLLKEARALMSIAAGCLATIGKNLDKANRAARTAAKKAGMNMPDDYEAPEPEAQPEPVNTASTETEEMQAAA